MDCIVVALMSAENICMHEAGCIPMAYVCDVSLWRVRFCARLRKY